MLNKEKGQVDMERKTPLLQMQVLKSNYAT